MKRNFIILFDEKEGTSPLVRLLNNFEQISIVHQIDNSGWEPFDRHNCGSMTLKQLESCLNFIWKEEPVDFKVLNNIYTKTAKNPLEDIGVSNTIGFKMRFIPPSMDFQNAGIISWLSRFKIFRKMLSLRNYFLFRKMMFKILKKSQVIVFLAVRQDILRWALSKYHGDGSGKRGHLQFKVASGEITKADIGKISVDCERLEKIILDCEKLHLNKRKLIKNLRVAGIEAYPILYEEFLSNKMQYFRRMFKYLGLEIHDNEIEASLLKGAYFEKVHPNEISNFVENYQEVLDRFSDRFSPW